MTDAIADQQRAQRVPSRSLADLHLNTILAAADQGTSSGDEDIDAHGDETEDAWGSVGISIGKEQTRLTLPQTPAVEKAAAIEHAGGFFDGTYDDATGTRANRVLLEDDNEDADHEPLAEPAKATSAAQPPAIRIEQVKGNEPSRGARSILKDAFGFNRRRASSDADAKNGSRSKASLWSNMPSLGKHLPFSASRDTLNQDGTGARGQSGTSNQNRPRRLSDTQPYERQVGNQDFAKINSETTQSRYFNTDTGKEAEEEPAEAEHLPTNQAIQRIKSRPSTLRRSTSDNSLFVQRTMSRVSSLGDDSRFDDVHEQVNSRFKALKDSFQDSSIKLPSISSLTPDFFRDRANSTSSKSRQTMKGRKPEDPITGQPYHSVKTAVHDAPIDKNALTHPHFTKASNHLEGDLVILGGYRGSILRSAEPPHRQVWVPIKVGLNLRKVDLEVGIREEDDERATETIIPDGMLTHIGPFDISRRLFKRMRACDKAKSEKLRVHDYGYDWRLHPLHLSRKLVAFLEGLPCNQPETPKSQRGATVICHSLGGLITRHAVNQRPELFRGVVYAGVPKTCVNILGPLRNGDDVLLSSRVLTAQVNFTIRTSYALLPLNGRCFFDKNTKEEYRVDFFDPQTWVDYRLSPCVARPLPPLTTATKPSGITGYVNSVAQSFPSLPLPGRKGSISRSRSPADPSKATVAGGVAEPDMAASSERESDIAIAHGNIDHDTQKSYDSTAATAAVPPSVRTAVSIPPDDAMEYLTRTLRTVKQFKQELAFNQAHERANIYPPIAVIYGKTTPTVFGAKVDGREGIKHADAYDDLAFASGDGVVLARAAMVPEGYRTAKGGIASSDRGHVTLLGDLEAVGKCLNAVMRERRQGVGTGVSK